MIRAAVAQIGSVLFDTPSTLRKVETRCREAASSGAQLLVIPEALLGGYPKGLTFGATVGNRTDEGRELFRRYSEAAIQCPGPETEMLSSWANELSLHIVIGVVERAGDTLYCSSLLFSPQQGLIAKHRKLMPTGSERLIWKIRGRLNHASRGYRAGPHRHGNLLGELYALVPAALLQSGRSALVRAHGGRARDLAVEYASHCV